MDLVTLADVLKLIGHLSKDTRAKSTWQLVDTKPQKAAAGGDVADLWAALQMVLMLERVAYRPK